MLHYFKFRQELFDPLPGREVYVKRPSGKGCRNSARQSGRRIRLDGICFQNFSIEFVRTKSGWRVEPMW